MVNDILVTVSFFDFLECSALIGPISIRLDKVHFVAENCLVQDFGGFRPETETSHDLETSTPKDLKKALAPFFLKSVMMSDHARA